MRWASKDVLAREKQKKDVIVVLFDMLRGFFLEATKAHHVSALQVCVLHRLLSPVSLIIDHGTGLHVVQGAAQLRFLIGASTDDILAQGIQGFPQECVVIAAGEPLAGNTGDGDQDPEEG